MAVNISFYDKAIQYGLETAPSGERIDYEAGPIRASLMTDTHTFIKTELLWSELSANEAANGTGYATGGTNLAGVTISMPSGGTVMFDADDHSWVASGGTVPTSGTAEHCTLRFSGTLSDDTHTIANINFGTTEKAGDGTKFLITWHANGIFRIVET